MTRAPGTPQRFFDWLCERADQEGSAWGEAARAIRRDPCESFRDEDARGIWQHYVMCWMLVDGQPSPVDIEEGFADATVLYDIARKVEASNA